MSDSVASELLLEQLTASQREAVLHETGPLMVLAGPGSGKTRVVTARVARLIAAGVDSHRIVALTFTNKAAEEMKQRVAELAGDHQAWISTFHRFCSYLLRQHAALVGLDANFSIYDTTDSLRALKAVMAEEDLAAARVQPRQLLRAISNAKNRLVSPEQFETRAVSNVDVLAAAVYPQYQQRLLRSNAVDFDDLLGHVANLLAENNELRAELDQRYEYLLVDEYQDTNYAQYRIIQALAQDYTNLTVTGDPDQSIYGWRGAHLNNVLDFERDFSNVRVVRLQENFRSTASIVQAADAVIANNRYRKPKSLIATRPSGVPVSLNRFLTGESEGTWIADHIAAATKQGTARLGDFAILYRVNACSRIIEHALMSAGIPYRVVNGLEFYQRKEIKDTLAYLNLINNPRNDVAFLRVLNEPPRGVGPKNLERISDFATARRISLWEAVCSPDCLQALSARPAKNMKHFVTALSDLMQEQHGSLATFISRVIDRTGYGPHLRNSANEREQDRLENLGELVVAADSFETEMQGQATLEQFLEQKALVNETDDLEIGDTVTLMTLHAAKGLEFPQVFLIAIEDGTLPHVRAKDEPLELEEERRLFFVGITRAEEHLYLSYADYRRRQDGVKRTITSQFLGELPRESIQYASHADHYGRFDRAGEDDSTAHYECEGEEDLVFRREQGFDAPNTTAAAVTSCDPANSVTAAPLVTAASLLGDIVNAPKTANPDVFEEGMLVTHPTHGHGKVLSVSGKGAKRTAKVVFFSTATELTMVLVHSPLQPLQANTDLD